MLLNLLHAAVGKPSDRLPLTPAPSSTQQAAEALLLPALEPDGGTDLLKFITWGYANFPKTANEPTPSYSSLSGFSREYQGATTAEHLQAFVHGYHNGKPESIVGYKPGMTVEMLMGLYYGCTSKAQIGTLSRLITERILHSAPKRQWADAKALSYPADSPPSALSAALNKRQDLKSLAQKLGELVTQLGSDASPQSVNAALKTTTMVLQPGTAPVGLHTLIASLGLALPVNYPDLLTLAHTVSDSAKVHPLGNLSGALSWPVPLNLDEQAQLAAFAQTHTHLLGAKQQVAHTQGGVLEFLRYQLPLWSDTLNDPAKLLDALLDSPQARAMGKALRENMQGVKTASSDSEFLLAAINLQLDPASATAFDRNKVAGFDLASPEHFGKPLSAVFERLKQHLINQGKTSPMTAGASAHLLLASRAPVYLIKDIPSTVTYGSPAWLNLVVAAATIEAQTPGKVASMTFAQVMQAAQSAELVDTTVSKNTQTAALLDWGNANGVMPRKADERYTPQDLKTLLNAFNARMAQMHSAIDALDKELPSRKAMALAELSRRFPGQEALFEVKEIMVLQRYQPDRGGPVRETAKLAGRHSMLDIAMMSDKDRSLVFRSENTRLPITQLNANHQFSVLDAFEAEFAEGIEAKKNAVATSIQHLISQLPLEDRQNFEYGEVSFFQNTAYTMGTGLWGATPLPTGKGLMVSIKHNGKNSAYKINFDRGSITHALPWQAAEHEKQDGSRVDKTQAFGETLPARATQQPLDSFASARTRAIADTFVKHLDLDNKDIKDQAKGLTTDEQRDKQVAQIVDVVLDVIPFRSAIVSFQKGNVGDGVFDLALDLFGFLTAGTGVVGKALKIGNTALSTATKAYKVAKVIGVATVGMLNPLDGVDGLALGATRLAGRGLKPIGAKVLQGLNKLRGASGSYDLLHAASKEHGLALIGTYKVAGVATEGVAVLKNDRWYKYDHVTNTLYGLPIEDFTPRGMLSGSESAESLQLYQNLTRARSPVNYPAYTRGYKNGRLQALPGYRDGMRSKELRALAAANDRSPDEMGILYRELKKAYIEDAEYTSALLNQDVAGPGVKVTASSQISYNAHVDIPSIGECAGMSYAMAVAIEAGNEIQFLKNMIKAAADPNSPAAKKFIRDLRELQHAVKKPNIFHNDENPVSMGYQHIINNLATFKTSTTVRIGTKDHAMLAGVRVDPDSGKKEWFFYEPNSGYATFNNAMSMREGLENVLDSGKIAAINNTLKSRTGTRQYTVSGFEPSDLNRPGIDAKAVEELSSIEL